MGTGGSGETFGELLRRFRRAAGLTQEELAALTGLSVRTISGMEAGRTARPYRRSVRLLTEALGLAEHDSELLMFSARYGGALPDEARQAARPAQLPPDIAEFTGRVEQVSWLTDLLTRTDERPVRIGAITGAGGIGKSALAVHVAHLLSEQFPHGQLFAELQGASDEPVPAGEALARFLRHLGMADSAIPAGLAERAAEFRTRMAGLRMLVVLDDARDAAHVRPLLPGTASSAVLITSRGWLADLEGGKVLVLGSLGKAEARALFASVCGADRVAAEPEATDSLLGACGGLPLAIRIAAARLVSRPAWDISVLASRLGNELHRLEELQIGDLALRATFQISYATLAASPNASRPGQLTDAGRAFRLLGLWPGADIGLQAAAALLGIESAAASRVLDRLVDVHMLEAKAAQRYRFHDLIRAFAAERAAQDEPAESREAALKRILPWYLHTCDRALTALDVPSSYENDLLPVPPDAEPLAFTEYDTAAIWMDSERENIVTAVQLASRAGLDEICGQLADVTWRGFLRSPWDGWLRVLEIGIASAAAAGNASQQAWLHNHKGIALMFFGAYVEALGCFDDAMRLSKAVANTRCEAAVTGNMAIAYKELRRYDEAIATFEASMELDPDIMRRGRTLMNLGMIYVEVDRVPEAIRSMEQALALVNEAGDHWGDSLGRSLLADAYRRDGRHADAITAAELALEISQRNHDEYQQSAAWHALGQALAEIGQRERARSCLLNAHELADRLGVPEAKQIAAAIAELESATP
ncbi:MAG TPA: tetratricopeptide repeat protein [Streptosporangiaceae bacterium]|nr:tetratricopeptide repeat protein [Streptosporangiaceae bacterium]